MSLGPSALPPIDESRLPAEIRNGSKQDKKDYQAALGFEQMLVGELTKSMTATANPVDDSQDDGSQDDGESGSDSIAAGTDAATSTYMQMLPDQLASAIMSNGGLGLAKSFYDSIEERR